jgi:hypothetical protein
VVFGPVPAFASFDEIKLYLPADFNLAKLNRAEEM